MKSIWLTILVVSLAAGVMAADFTDYGKIAISSPLITQIYTNPEISENEDVELSSESQIKLYENLSDDICSAISKRYENDVDFLCLGDIQVRLDDTKSWNDFNRLFTGRNNVSVDIAGDFAEKLGVDGVLNSYLMFSYYNNDDQARHLELHFEWYLIDLSSGESVLSDEYDCQDDLKIAVEDWDTEFACFAGILDFFAGEKDSK